MIAKIFSSALNNDFCYAEFLAYYTLKNKSNNSCEYQPDELDDRLIEKNHEESSYPKQIKLMISGERMWCHKVRRILRYHVPNKILYPEIFAYHVLFFSYPFRDEKKLLSGLPPLYQNKLQEQGVQDIVSNKEIKFEPYVGLVDEVYSRLSETLTIKIRIVKLKMIKFQEQNVPTTMIQKTQKQTKLLQFQLLCQKYYQIMKSQKV